MKERIQRLKTAIREADAVVIGAGAGMSTAAGYVYTGERFDKYFSDFSASFGFHDMYSGGFYPYPTEELRWGFWSRYVWINRYMDAPGHAYHDLLKAVEDKPYFVLTTNVDHCFQKAGFDKERLFYTQGDYGLFQCSKPCCRKTWDNEETIRRMVLAQGYTIGEDNELIPPTEGKPAMEVPTALLPKCPNCGRPLTMNLRADDTFVEDEGWYVANDRYGAFIDACEGKRVVYLEIGVGYNTPGIIKYSFWQQTYRNEKALYACLNLDEEPVPEQIADRSIVVAGDSAEALRLLEEA